MTINFFAVTRFVHLDSKELDLPVFGSGFFVVEFSVKNLENPKTDPIGLYFYSGIRRYLWRDKYWSEYDLPHRTVSELLAKKLRDCIDKKEAIRLRSWLDILKDYSKSVGPSGSDKVDNPLTQDKVFHRVIYEINDG